MLHKLDIKQKNPDNLPIDNIQSYTREFIQRNVDVLNELHGTNYSAHFWDILLYAYINKAIRFFKVLDESNLAIGTYSRSFAEPNAYRLLFENKRFRLKNKLEILKHFSNKLSINIKSNTQISDNVKYVTIGHRKNELSKLGYGVVYHDTNGQLLRNSSRTKKLIEISSNLSDLDRSVIRSLPKIFVEYLPSYLEVMPNLNYSDVIINGTLHGSFEERVFLAHATDRGAKFHYYQDGEDNESIKNSLRFKRTLQLADVYNSFGWVLNSKTVPFGAVRLLQFENKYKSSSVDFDILIPLVPIEKNNRAYVKSVAKLFFDKIDQNKYGKIGVRPRSPSRRTSLLNPKIDYKSLNFPSNIKITKGIGSSAEEVAKSRCVVNWFTPSTIFLECIFVNHPVFILKPLYPLTETFEPIYEKLKEMKIVHNDVESLCNHLNNINVEEWWAELSGSSEFKEIKNTIAKRPPVNN